jgi:ubiquinone/menaquinone biosynthesis C-methylase UbiE
VQSIGLWRRPFDSPPIATTPSWFEIDQELVHGILRDHLNGASRVLHLGCGTSALVEELESLRIDELVHFDRSRRALETIQRRLAPVKHITTVEGGCEDMPFAPGYFDRIVDKGTLDVFVNTSDHTAREVLDKIRRILAPGGIYMQITTDPPAVRQQLFPARTWRFLSRDVSLDGAQYSTYLHTAQLLLL